MPWQIFFFDSYKFEKIVCLDNFFHELRIEDKLKLSFLICGLKSENSFRLSAELLLATDPLPIFIIGSLGLC